VVPVRDAKSSKPLGDLDQEVDELRRSYKRAIEPHASRYPDHYQEFLQDLEHYLDDLKSFRFRSWLAHDAMRFHVSFCVENFGSASASKVEAQVQFDGWVAIYDSAEWLKDDSELIEPAAPKVPAPPKPPSTSDFGWLNIGPILYPDPIPSYLLGNLNLPQFPTVRTEPVDPSAWVESGKIEIEIPNLKSGRSWCTQEFYVFMDPISSSGLRASCVIHANELSAELHAELHLVFSPEGSLEL
jgi:hypothetical protein